MLQRLEDLFGKFALYPDTLHDAGSVAQLWEDDFAGFAQVVEPTRELHFFSDVLARVGDSNPRRSAHRTGSGAVSASSRSKTLLHEFQRIRHSGGFLQFQQQGILLRTGSELTA